MKNFSFGNHLFSIVYHKGKYDRLFSIDILFIGRQMFATRIIDSYRVEVSLIFLDNKVGIHTSVRFP